MTLTRISLSWDDSSKNAEILPPDDIPSPPVDRSNKQDQSQVRTFALFDATAATSSRADHGSIQDKNHAMFLTPPDSTNNTRVVKVRKNIGGFLVVIGSLLLACVFIGIKDKIGWMESPTKMHGPVTSLDQVDHETTFSLSIHDASKDKTSQDFRLAREGRHTSDPWRLTSFGSLRQQNEEGTVHGGSGGVRRKVQDDNRPKSLQERIATLFILRDLEAYLAHSGILEDIKGDGPFTLITPWDTPFENLEASLVAKLRNPAWRAHLRNLLQYHLYLGDITPESLGPTQMFTMVNGETIVLTRDPPSSRRFFINGTIVVADYDATNGHAYMLDTVLLPSWYGRFLLPILRNDYPSFSSLISQAQLESRFTNSQGWTILVPNESAFSKLDQATLDFLSSDQGHGVLEDTVLYHVLEGGPFAWINVMPLLPLTLETLLGETITLSPGAPPSFKGVHNEAFVTQFDQLANNGIFHVVDTVLLLGPGGNTITPGTPATSTPTLTPTMFPANEPTSDECTCPPAPTSPDPPPNDSCASAQSIEIGGPLLIGTTVNATIETRNSDVHYSIVGNGRRVKISTCFKATTTAHNFVIRNGGCSGSVVTGSEVGNDPSCNGNPNAAAFEFDTVLNRFYPIHVYPRNSIRQGQFAIQVTDYISPSNDNCLQYRTLEVGGPPVQGSTVNATAETRGEDVHYGFVGDGSRVKVTTCSQDTTTAHNFLIRNGGCSGSVVTGSEVSSDFSCPGNPNAAAFEFDTASGLYKELSATRKFCHQCYWVS